MTNAARRLCLRQSDSSVAVGFGAWMYLKTCSGNCSSSMTTHMSSGYWRIAVRAVTPCGRSWGTPVQIDFDAAHHAYSIDGKPVPSVTQVLAPQNDWSHVDAWALEAAAALG